VNSLSRIPPSLAEQPPHGNSLSYDRFENVLGKLYEEGSQEVRTCVVQATLEHLFEQKDIRKFFSDWQKDEVLKVAFGEASEWYKGGGRTPLERP
jgi:hypothetical protein